MAVYVGSSGVELDRWSDATGYGNNAEGRLIAYSRQGDATSNSSTVYFKGQVSCSTGSVYNNDAHYSSVSGTGPMGDGHNATQTWAFGSVPDTSGHEVTGDSSDMYGSGLKHRADGTCSLTLNASGTRGNNSSFSTNISITLPTISRTYTVSYNANGGTGAPNSQTKTQNVTLTLSSTKPTRTGYTFSKWNTKADGSGTNYNPGASYTTNAALTLYAQGTINTYTVTINPNGGSFTSSKNSAAQSTAQSYTVNYGSSITNITASRSGYMSAGGFTEASGGTKIINNGGSLNSISSSRTIYAQGTKEDPPPDPIYDVYTKISGVGVPGAIGIKVNGTGQRSLETTLKINGSGRKMKAQ